MENQALHRVFNVFLLGLAAECYLFIVQRFYTASTVSSLLLWDRILRWGVWLGLVMLVAGVVVAVVKRNQAKLRTAMTWVAGIGAFLAVSGWVITRFFDQNRGITAMCIAVPVLTLLGLVYFLFQHECFATTVILTGSLFSVWVCGNGVSGTWRVPVIVCAMLVVIALVVLNIAFTGISLALGAAFYGYGFCLAMLVTLCVGLFMLSRELNRLEYKTFMLQ